MRKSTSRQVRCQDTGQMQNKENSWQAPNKKYYSSEEAYNQLQIAKEYRKQVVELIMEILGYEAGMKLPTIYYKKIEEYREPYGFEVLYECVKNQRSAIEWVLNNKEFKSEVQQGLYIMAVIQNNINDEFKRFKAKQKRIKKENKQEAPYEFTGKAKKYKDVTDLVGDL